MTYRRAIQVIRSSAGSVLCAGRVLLIVATASLLASFAHAQVQFTGTQFNIAGNTLSSPSGVAVDGKGNVYIADRGNNRILRVTPSTNGNGTVATILSGLSGPAGVAADWSGNVYIADTGNNRILMLPLTKGVLGGPVTVGSGFSSPAGVAIDTAENLYIADSGNNRIMELPRVGNGYGSAIQLMSGLNSPTEIAVDAARNLYIADTGNSRVLKEIHSNAGYLTQQYLGRGLVAPTGVAVDKSYNVYIADTGNNRLVEEPWFAGAKRYNAQVSIGSDVASPAAVVSDWDGNVYAADLGNNQVIEVVTASVDFGSFQVGAVGAGGAKQTYNFNIGSGTVIGSIGIYTQGATGKDFVDSGSSTCVVDTYTAATACGVNVAFIPLASGLRTGAIVFYDDQGNALAATFISGTGMKPRAAFFPGNRTLLGTQLSGPSGVAVDGNGNVFIADTGNNRVLEIPRIDTSYGTQVTVAVNRLESPMGMTVDGAGNLYVVSNGNDTILKLPWTGNGFGIQAKVGSNFYGPTGIAADAGGNIFIADTLDQFVWALPWTGSTFGRALHLGATVRCPLGVAVDPSRNVYFSMPYYNSIQQIPLVDGRYVQQEQTPQLKVSRPSALAMDGNSNLYILDTGNNRVIMAPWNGNSYGAQFTIADGFNAPSGLAVDGDGNLYVADTGNNQVVKIDLSTPTPLSFADTYVGSTSSDSAQTIHVENTGNQPLVLSSVDYPQDYPNGQRAINPCFNGGNLPQGTSCQLAVSFTPKTVGLPLRETLGIQFDGLVSQQSIRLSGVSISKLAQTISFPAIPDVIYGITSVGLSATSSAGLPVTYHVVSGPATLARNGAALNVTGAGLVIVQASQSGTLAYGAAPATAVSFQVLPAVLTITPVTAIATYGAIPSTFSYVVTGFIAGQSAVKVLAGSAIVRSNANTKSGAGTYMLTVTQGSLVAANYKFVTASAILTVNKVTLTVNAAAISSIYGAAPPKASWTFSGFMNGDGPAAIRGTPAMKLAVNPHSPVGSYAVTPTQGTLTSSNYSFAFVSGILSILPAQLTVTANNQSFVYGKVTQPLQYSITGFVNGETAANAVTGAPSLSTKMTSSAGTGTYPVAPLTGTLKARNYSFRFVAGVIKVTKAILVVTAVDTLMTYGDKVPAFTYKISGFVGADTKTTSVSGVPILSTTANAHTIPGTARITAVNGTLSSRNYTFTFKAGTITITKAKLTLQVKAASMIYGSAVPAFSYEFKGFVNGDGGSTVSGGPAIVSQGKPSSSVGQYALTAKIGTLASSRYSFQFAGNTLFVTKAILTVVPNTASMIYGSPLPALSYYVTGLVNGDKAAVIAGKPSLQTTASAHAQAGIYEIQAGPGNLSASNYSFIFASSKIAVTKATLTVTPNAQSMIYGASIPTFTFKCSGFVNGDTARVAVDGLPTFSTTATPTSPLGTYPIAIAQGKMVSANYNLTFVNGTLTINSK